MLPLTLVYFLQIFSCLIVGSGEEEEELAATMMAPTSTSNTLVLSDTRRAAEEPSSPRQHDVEASTPVASPRAPSPKRARIELGESYNCFAGSSTTPPFDDVSASATIFILSILNFYLLSTRAFSPLNLPFDFIFVASDGTFHQSRYPVYWVS
jgi:hypothetical protein